MRRPPQEAWLRGRSVTTARRKSYGVKGAPSLPPPATIPLRPLLALPIGYALWLSLHKVQVKGLGLGSGARKEISGGAGDSKDALSDSELLSGAVRVLGYGAIVIPVMLGLALLFALMLDTDKVRLAPFTRLAIFLPYAIPGVVAALLCSSYLPDVSPCSSSTSWGCRSRTFWTAARCISPCPTSRSGESTGFNMIVIYTSLQAIPARSEAAKLDGATPLQIALKIKIPMVAPSLVLAHLLLLDHRDAPGVQRADHPQTPHQLRLHDLEIR